MHDSVIDDDDDDNNNDEIAFGKIIRTSEKLFVRLHMFVIYIHLTELAQNHILMWICSPIQSYYVKLVSSHNSKLISSDNHIFG